MKIDLEKLTDFHVRDSNTVAATLFVPGVARAQVNLRRYFVGWRPCLEIQVDGAIVYDNEADQELQQEFETMMTVARGGEGDRKNAHRSHARNILQMSGLFTYPAPVNPRSVKK